MMQYYFTFLSMTQAQTAVSRLGRKGIGATVGRTPLELALRGCGYSVRVEERDVRAAAAALNGAGIAYRGIYQLREDRMEEVIL